MCLIICTRQTKKTNGKSVQLPCVFFSTRQRKMNGGRSSFAVCQTAGTRQTKRPQPARMFAVCPTSGTRQRRKRCRVLRFAVFFFHKSTVNERLLPSVGSLPCVFLRGTRRMPSLRCAIYFPCAAVRAHGKGPLYRVPEIQHTAKPKGHGKYAQSRSAS